MCSRLWITRCLTIFDIVYSNRKKLSTCRRQPYSFDPTNNFTYNNWISLSIHWNLHYNCTITCKHIHQQQNYLTVADKINKTSYLMHHPHPLWIAIVIANTITKTLALSRNKINAKHGRRGSSCRSAALPPDARMPWGRTTVNHAPIARPDPVIE